MSALSRIITTLFFVVTTFLFLYLYEGDILYVVQNKLSEGKTHYDDTIGAVLITVVMYLIHLFTLAVTGLRSKGFGLTFFPPILLLSALLLLRPEAKVGTAYIAGFKWALEHGYEYIFEMDADFSHAPADLPRLLAACRDEGYDMSIGSRYITGVNVVNWPMGRVLMSYFASKYVRMVTGLNIHDTTAGFVCYRRRVLETIDLDDIRFKGYAFQIEMKFTAYKCGFKIKEVPVIFVNRELGTSKMSGGIFSEAAFGVMRLRWDGWFKNYPKPVN